jgi:hypothetical protein
MGRTTTKPLRTRRPPREVFLVRGGTRSAPAQHKPVLSERIRSEDGVPSTYPDRGATSLCRACIKVRDGCCHPPKNRVDGAGR